MKFVKRLAKVDGLGQGRGSMGRDPAKLEFFVRRSKANGNLCVRTWQQLFERTVGGVGKFL